jgi:hypothetical protein
MFPKSCSITNKPRTLLDESKGGTKSSQTSHVIILEDTICASEGQHRTCISEVSCEGEQCTNKWLESSRALLVVDIWKRMNTDWLRRVE